MSGDGSKARKIREETAIYAPWAVSGGTYVSLKERVAALRRAFKKFDRCERERKKSDKRGI